ncbi:hypothetical protein DENIT_130053 [Pseudomonas veronii]|nr:hypothetical protein DENIT_130053 [Pseudomonas veronii]
MHFLACVRGLGHGYNRSLLCPHNITNKVWLAKINMWEGASPLPHLIEQTNQSPNNNEDYLWSMKPGKS